MRTQKFIKIFVIACFIACGIFIAIDIIKSLKISADFMKMQESSRITSSSNEAAIRYEPTDYNIKNKGEMLDAVKNLTYDLKSNFVVSKDLFEIANIHKIESYFYEYKKYLVVKYKLLNIIDDLPKIYSQTKGVTNAEIENYFNKNRDHIEKYYGITESSEFVELAKSLNFLGSDKVNLAIILTETIAFEPDSEVLTFYIKLKTNKDNKVYFVKVCYTKTSDLQVLPYLSFIVND